MNSAIIVAAGTGSRFGGEIPKQFVDLCGRSVLEHTIDKFQSCKAVDEIVLVLSAEAVPEVTQYLDVSRFEKISQVVQGGDTRMESVANGLEAVSEQCDIVAVHDGARPLVSSDEIEEVIAIAKRSGAACLVAKIADTIKTIRGDEIAGTLNREELRRALTPQAFRIEVLKRAFDVYSGNAPATDECYLVEHLGHPIALVEGDARNIKITSREDLLFAEALILAARE